MSRGRVTSENEIVLRILSAASFLIFFQSYLVAPLIPALSVEFNSSEQIIGLLVPAYLVPYGISTLFYGPIADRIGSKKILLTLLGVMAVMIAGFATSRNTTDMMAWRFFGGITAGGIIPIGLALLSDLFPYEKRGHAMGWVFGGIAGGVAFGSTLGAFFNPIIGWRAELFVTAFFSAIVFGFALRHRSDFEASTKSEPLGFAKTFVGYFQLASSSRGWRGYSVIFLNGMFHSGVFSWLGLFLAERYHLGDKGIGLALLGYGVPGMLLGPYIGRLADRLGRRRLIPVGMLIAALSAAALIPHSPLLWPALVIAVLSLGFDMTHPLLVGIVSSLDAKRRGQVMGLNAFCLFTGFGLGTLVFQICLRKGFVFALAIFATAQLILAIASLAFFKDERTSVARS